MPERFPFRQRAHEVSRLEAFSDIVFGFAMTLIVVSLEVPKTYDELMEAMRGFPTFALCFAILIWIWHLHYTFFRRYALHDEFTLIMNTLLLFLVLFYVYPLKFIFSAMFKRSMVESGTQARTLFVIYGLGFVGIFLLYGLLYFHAWRLRESLQLNAAEQHDTRGHLQMIIGNLCVGLLSVLMAMTFPTRYVGLAGFIYFLLGPVNGIIGTINGRKRDKIADAMAAAAAL
jgi:uncharacterized membrane protein